MLCYVSCAIVLANIRYDLCLLNADTQHNKSIKNIKVFTFINIYGQIAKFHFWHTILCNNFIYIIIKMELIVDHYQEKAFLLYHTRASSSMLWNLGLSIFRVFELSLMGNDFAHCVGQVTGGQQYPNENKNIQKRYIGSTWWLTWK